MHSLTTSKGALGALLLGCSTLAAQSPTLTVNEILTLPGTPFGRAVAGQYTVNEARFGNPIEIHRSAAAYGRPTALPHGTVELTFFQFPWETILPVPTTGPLGSPLSATDLFGASVTGARVDYLSIDHQVLIGSPGRNGGGGLVAIHDASVNTGTTPLRATIQLLPGPSDSQFGAEVTNLGDLNGDGREEFAVSSRNAIRVYDGMSLGLAPGSDPFDPQVPFDADDPAILVTTHTDMALTTDDIVSGRIASPAVGVGDVTGDRLDDYAYVRDLGVRYEIAFVSEGGEEQRSPVTIPCRDGDVWLAGGADIDKDAAPDVAVLCRNRTTQIVTVFTLLSGNNYAVSPVTTGPLFIQLAEDIALVDYDRDLFAEVAVASTGAGVQFYDLDPVTGTLVAGPTVTPPPATGGFGLNIASLTNNDVENSSRILVVGSGNVPSASLVESNLAGNPVRQIVQNDLDATSVCPGSMPMIERPTMDLVGGANPSETNLRFVMNHAFPNSLAQIWIHPVAGAVADPNFCNLVVSAGGIAGPVMMTDARGTAEFTPFGPAGVSGISLLAQIVVASPSGQTATAPAATISVF